MAILYERLCENMKKAKQRNQMIKGHKHIEEMDLVLKRKRNFNGECLLSISWSEREKKFSIASCNFWVASIYCAEIHLSDFDYIKLPTKLKFNHIREMNPLSWLSI